MTARKFAQLQCPLFEAYKLKELDSSMFKSLFRSNTKQIGQYNDLLEAVISKPLPKHVAIIMDGNGRWAKKRNLPRVAGHRQGVEAIRDTIKLTSELDIKYLSLYAFSTENWKRPKAEVNALMGLLVEYLQKEIDELHKNDVRIKVIGDITGLPPEAQREVYKAIEKTNNNQKLQVNIALNYGSRVEIIKGIKKIIKDIEKGKIISEDITDKLFASYLDTCGVPDPDLLVRTSGEYRLSNFMLYQLAYTELYFTDKDILWPDFDRIQYLTALIEYQNRQRRYGGIEIGENK